MKYVITIISICFLFSCEAARIGEQKALGLNIKSTTTATVETTPTPQGKEDDSADDPAIWINYNAPEKSIVFGTDKKGGIGAYSLKGEELNYYKVGKINNIDIRQKLSFQEYKFDVIGGSNRTKNNIFLALINSDGKLVEQPIQGVNIPEDEKVYGFTLGYINDALLAILNDKSGNIYIYELSYINNQVVADLRKQIKLNSQPEGMVVDDTQKVLYVGEEEHGIWRIDLTDYSSKLLEMSTEDTNEFIRYDIEGISIYPTSETTGYLIASSQGNNSYAVFKREGNNDYITSFRVVDGEIDGIEETDGVDVVNFNFGEPFPNGFFIAQDGFNYDGETKKSQNFKLVDWRNIEKLIQQK